MKKVKMILMTIAITSMLVPVSMYSGDDKEAFKALDKNSNGKIEMDEFADCITSSSFREWDADGNNYLSEDEFKKSEIAKATKNKSGMKSDKSGTTQEGTSQRSTDQSGTGSNDWSSTTTGQGAGSGTGVGAEGSGTAGSGTAGSGTAGSGTYGTGAGSGTAGSGTGTGDMGTSRQDDQSTKPAGQRSHDFSSWDINSDGQLSMTELRNAVFRMYDANGNGTLDSSEFTEVDSICDSQSLL